MATQEIILRLTAAAVLGGIIGIERQIKHHPAGLRTNILVCIGSAAVMILSELLAEKYYILYNEVSDPARLGAQVISGIGFLGAGTIIHSDSQVKGLTTAASVWTISCVGLVVGAGYYLTASLITFLVLVVLVVFNMISQWLTKRGQYRITIKTKPKSRTVGEVILALSEIGAEVYELEAKLASEHEDSVQSSEIVFRVPRHIQVQTIFSKLQNIDGVLEVIT